jgi:hypothetical protein
MLPTDDSADDYVSAVGRATLDAEDAAHLPVIWLACHGDWGADSQADIDGHTYVLQAKRLVSQADAQRMTRQSVLVFLNACQSSDAGDERTSFLRRLESMTITRNYDRVIEQAASNSDFPASVYLLAAAPYPSAQSEALTYEGLVSKLLSDSLSRWSDVAGRIPVVPVLDGFDEAWLEERVCPVQAVAAAQHATSAAYRARDAVVHEDPSVSRDMVARFTSTWLGFRPTPEIVDAAAAALLYASLDDFDPDDDAAAVRLLRRDTMHQNRLLKPLTSTQLCHYPIDSLDRPLCVDLDEGTLGTLADTIGVPDQVDELMARIGGWEDVRIDKILARLHQDERLVAVTYAHLEATGTWQQAAQACGLSAEFGERVRRKLRREGRSLEAVEAPRGQGRSRAA